MDSEQLIAENQQLIAENVKLRQILSAKLASEADLRAVIDMDRISMNYEGGLAEILALGFSDQLTKSEAKNFIEMHFHPQDPDAPGSIIVTVRHETGLSPTEMRDMAYQERDAALAELAELKASLA